MWVRLHCQVCIVLRATPEEVDWLQTLLRVENKAEMTARAFRDPGGRGGSLTIDMGWRDLSGRICFPPGLLPVIRRAAQAAKQTVEVQDSREVPPGWPQNPVEAARRVAQQVGLRDYQEGALVALARGTSESMPIQYPLPGRGICKIVTGGGKGVIAAVVPLFAPGNWAFFVHRGHLAADIRERYHRLSGEEAGFIGDGEWDPREGLTCATTQSLFAALHTPRFKAWAKTVTGVMIDEVHTIASDTYSQVAKAFPNAYATFGFSGTPLDRSDKKSILSVAAVGPVVYEVRADELIERGYIAKPTIRVIPVWQPEYKGSDWPGLYKAKIKESPHRNGAIAAAMVKAEAPGIVFVRHLDHGKELVRLAHLKGLDADFVDGSWSLERRQAVIRKLDTGRLQWIVASSVFAEGVDIPCLRTVINGGGGKAIIATLQQIGRGSRMAEGKSTFVCYDIGDSGNRVLNAHAHARVQAAQREGYDCVIDESLWPKRALKVG